MSEEDEFSSSSCLVSSEDSGSDSEVGSPPSHASEAAAATLPPCYSSVLLEHHLSRALMFTSEPLFPSDLVTSLKELLRGLHLAPNHLRTYHTLSGRNFSEGSGTYRGELDHKSRRNGYGHVLYLNGDRFAGHWKKNLRHGHGAYFWSETGSVYSGEWASGERRGRGHFLFGPRRGGSDSDALGGAVVTGRWAGGRLVGGGEATVAEEENGVRRVKVEREEEAPMAGLKKIMKTLSLK